MNGLNKILLSLLLVVSGNCANGQENLWPLQKCLDVALQNNIEVKLRQLEVKRTQKAKNSVLSQMLPAVNLFGEQSYNFGSTIDPSTNARVSSNIQYDNFYINAQMNLIDFNAFANVQKNKIDIERAKAEQEIIENEYKLQVLESYYEALFTQELVRIQKEQMINTEFNLDRITKEVNIGSKPKSDLYDMQLNWAQEQKRLLETQQLAIIQKMQLFQLMNYTSVEITTVVLEPYLASDSQTVSVTSFNNPKIKFAELNFKSSQNAVRLQKSQLMPTLSSYYTFSSFYYKPLNQPEVEVANFNNQLGDNKQHQVGIQLRVPVFSGFRNHKKVLETKIENEKNKLKIDQEKQKISQQIALENQNKINSLELKENLNQTLSYAQSSFTTTQSKFISGKVDAVVFSSVKNQLLSLQYDVLKNNLQLQYIDLKINLIQNNQL